MKLLAFLLLLASAQVNADCYTLARTWDAGAKQNVRTRIFSHDEYKIHNQTSSTQVYQVCHELSTQFFDHKDKQTNFFCEYIKLNSGEATAIIKNNPTLDVIYPQSSYVYHVAIDAIVEIKGECNSKSHDMKKLKLY